MRKVKKSLLQNENFIFPFPSVQVRWLFWAIYLILKGLEQLEQSTGKITDRVETLLVEILYLLLLTKNSRTLTFYKT